MRFSEDKKHCQPLYSLTLNADAIANSNDFAALQAQKSCASVQHFAPFPLFGRARSTSRYRMPPVLPSVGPEATLRTPDFRLPAIRPTFIFRPLRINLSTPKIKKVANECLQPSRPPGRLRRERDSNPRYSCPYTAFRVRPDRPLRHLSRSITNPSAGIRSANIAIFRKKSIFGTKKDSNFYFHPPNVFPDFIAIFVRY